MATQAERARKNQGCHRQGGKTHFWRTRLCLDHDGRHRRRRPRCQGRGLSSLPDQGGRVRSRIRAGLHRTRLGARSPRARGERSARRDGCGHAKAISRPARKGPTGQIILRDGPAVLGWERWREIDAKHFGGKFPLALTAAMEAGVIARQPIEPLARLLLGAVTEAAVAVSVGPDIAARRHRIRARVPRAARCAEGEVILRSDEV